MKVSGVGSKSTVSGGARRVGGSTGGGEVFGKALADAIGNTGETQGVDAPQATYGVDALLLIQAVDGTSEREARKRQARQGMDILDKLEELRRGLLSGGISEKTLRELSRLLGSQREACQDTQLLALLDDIHLRAEVELAKLERSTSLALRR